MKVFAFIRKPGVGSTGVVYVPINRVEGSPFVKMLKGLTKDPELHLEQVSVKPEDRTISFSKTDTKCSWFNPIPEEFRKQYHLWSCWSEDAEHEHCPTTAIRDFTEQDCKGCSFHCETFKDALAYSGKPIENYITRTKCWGEPIEVVDYVILDERCSYCKSSK